MSNKRKISDFSEADFLLFVTDIYHANNKIYKSEKQHADAVRLFEVLTEHPDGSDLIYYPNNNREDTPEGIVKEIKAWRKANGKSGFKDA